MNLLPRQLLEHITPLKQGIRLGNLRKRNPDSAAKDAISSERTQGSYFSRIEYDWEALDDYETTTKCHAWETLARALNRNDTSDAMILITLAKEFSTGCILHKPSNLAFQTKS